MKIPVKGGEVSVCVVPVDGGRPDIELTVGGPEASASVRLGPITASALVGALRAYVRHLEAIEDHERR